MDDYNESTELPRKFYIVITKMSLNTIDTTFSHNQ